MVGLAPPRLVWLFGEWLGQGPGPRTPDGVWSGGGFSAATTGFAFWRVVGAGPWAPKLWTGAGQVVGLAPPRLALLFGEWLGQGPGPRNSEDWHYVIDPVEQKSNLLFGGCFLLDSLSQSWSLAQVPEDV